MKEYQPRLCATQLDASSLQHEDSLHSVCSAPYDHGLLFTLATEQQLFGPRRAVLRAVAVAGNRQSGPGQPTGQRIGRGVDPCWACWPHARVSAAGSAGLPEGGWGPGSESPSTARGPTTTSYGIGEWVEGLSRFCGFLHAVYAALHAPLE